MISSKMKLIESQFLIKKNNEKKNYQNDHPKLYLGDHFFGG
jgi:hypothetical protein